MVNKFYIVPQSVCDAFNKYTEGQDSVDFIKLNNGMYAVTERIAEVFPEKFSEVATALRENNITIELRTISSDELDTSNMGPAIF